MSTGDWGEINIKRGYGFVVRQQANIYFISILALAVFLAALFFSFAQLQRDKIKKMRMRHYETQTDFLGKLCLEALAGNDFELLTQTIKLMREQDSSIGDIFIETPQIGQVGAELFSGGQNVLFRAVGAAPVQDTRLERPLIVAGRNWGTLVVLHDQEKMFSFLKQIPPRLVILGVLVFVFCSGLLYWVGKKSCGNRAAPEPEDISTNVEHGVKDPFAAPPLTYRSTFFLKQQDVAYRPALTAEQTRIIRAVTDGKNTLAHIIKECALDEPVAFELVRNLVCRSVLGMSPVEVTTIHFKSLLDEVSPR